MKYNYLKIIGLMTGTSMDGIDVSLVRTNGIDLQRLNENYFYKYSNKTKDLLLGIYKEDINFNLKRKNILDKIITDEHTKALKAFDLTKKSDLIGFHGQTIYHNPETKISLQLGDPLILAKTFNRNVIFNFRSKDIELGGQGAPLAPIYHQMIIKSLKIDLPSCILNIGGIANITFWDGEKLIGFDTGPGNALMDDYMKKISNNYFDKDGALASTGSVDIKTVKNFLKNSFFYTSPPKSLDRNSFSNLYKDLLNKNLSFPDTMATLAQLTVDSISIALGALPKKFKNILVTGGGCKNKYIMKLLKEKLDVNFIDENDTNIDFNYIESELIAYLSARSIYKLPYTFPSTTGVTKPSSGGDLYKYL